MVSGVTVAQGSSSAFQTAFTTATAAALGIDAADVIVKAITLVTVRRNLREQTSVHRALGISSAVKISYSVSSASSTTSVTTSLTNSAPTVTNSLNTVGATEGFVAVAGAPVIDFSTVVPTTSPTLAPADDLTEPPTPAPVAEVTEPVTPAPAAEVTEPVTPAPVADLPAVPETEDPAEEDLPTPALKA